MTRPITLFTGQWADLPFETLCQKASAWGYDGLEIACWGDHMDVRKAACRPGLRRRNARHPEPARPQVLGHRHPSGRPVRRRPARRAPGRLRPGRGQGQARERLRAWAVEEMKATARAAAEPGLRAWSTASRARRSGTWSTPSRRRRDEMIDDGFDKLFAELWTPILDVFDECGVKFALEVHPTEIAFDLYTAERLLDGVRAPAGVRLQLRPQPPALAGRRPAPSSSATSPTASTTST